MARVLPQPVFRVASGACLLLVLIGIQLSAATSDPVAMHCSPLCSKFSAVGHECAVMRKCFDFAYTDGETFTRCLEPCWDLSAPCMLLCADNYGNNFDTCNSQCSDSEDYSCVYRCFDQTFASLRDSTLTLPDPDIGPFVNDAE